MSLFKISLLNSIQVFICMCFFSLHSQQSNKVPDSLLIKSNNYIINALRTSSLEQDKVYHDVLISRGLTKNDLIAIYTDLSVLDYNKEDYVKCRYLLDKAKDLSRSHKDRVQLCKVYLKIGNTYLKQWNNQFALDEYYKALEIARKEKNLELEIIAKSSISIIRRRMNQLEKALEVSENALSLIDKTSYNGKQNHVNLITIVSDIYLELEHFDKAKKYVNQGLSISKAIDYKQGLIDLYIKKGILNQNNSDFERAEHFLDSANVMLLNNDFQNGLFKRNIDYYLANGFYNTERYGIAIEKLEFLIASVSPDELTKDRVVESHLLLAKSYESIGNEKQAVFWLNEHIRLNKKAQQEKDSTINEIYEKDTEILDASISTLKKYANYIKGSLIFIFLILIVVLIRSYKRKKTNKIVFDDLINKINQLERKEKNETQPANTSKEIIIDDKKVEEVLIRLNKLEDQDYFLSLDCNLRNLAKKVKTNATYLSKIINSEKNKNFNDYINDLRIEYVLKRLKSDKQFRLFSIKSIATEIGYKSDYSFAKHFKIKTGLNPSYYIKQLHVLNKK